MKVSQLTLRKMFDEPFEFKPYVLMDLAKVLGCTLDDIFN